MKDRFKDCFADTSDMFEYDILFEEKVVARAKVLTARDRAKIFHKSSHELDQMFYYLFHSLVSWELGVPITEQNLENLTRTPDGNKLFTEMAMQVLEKEKELAGVIEDNEKN